MLGKLLSLFSKRAPLPVPTFELPPTESMTDTGSGLLTLELTPGEGPCPGPTDKVTVHYAGWLTDGTLFDASYSRGAPASFPLDRVIAGWTEGLQLMNVGSTWKFVIPPRLGYGPRGAPPTIPPQATLLFQVELLAIG